MSEHEGFCLPLLESCYFRRAGRWPMTPAAVAETLDGAGILFRDKDPALVAGLVEQVLENEPLRRQLRAGAAAQDRDATAARPIPSSCWPCCGSCEAMISIGVVVQRYGNEVIGGAETLARNVAEQTAQGGFSRHRLHHLRPGLSHLAQRISRRRIDPAGGSPSGASRCARERDIAAFNRFSDEFFAAAAGGPR